MPNVYTSPQDGTTFDTYMQSSSATSNFDTNPALSIGEYNAGAAVYRALIQFPGLSDGSIPAGAHIASATLFIKTSTGASDNARTLRVYRSKRDVSFGQATWNIYSSGNNWQTAGGFGVNDCEQTDIGSVSVAASGSDVWYAIALSPTAIEEIVKNVWETPSLLLKVDTENNDLWIYCSSNHATVTSRPYIVVEYQLDGTQMSDSEEAMM